MRHFSKTRRLFLLGGAPLLISILAAAPSNAGPHVKVFGLSGPETVLGTRGYYKALSWSWGQTNPGAQGAAPVFSDLTLVLPSNNAGPKLFERLCNGTHIESVTLTTVIQSPPGGAGDTKYHEIVLQDVLISSYQFGGSAGNELPAVQYSLNFSKIEFVYVEKKADGSMETRVSRTCDNPVRQSP